MFIKIWHIVSADSPVGSVPTYSAIALQASWVRVPARGPFPILPPSLAPISLPVTVKQSYPNKGQK